MGSSQKIGSSQKVGSSHKVGFSQKVDLSQKVDSRQKVDSSQKVGSCKSLKSKNPKNGYDSKRIKVIVFKLLKLIWKVYTYILHTVESNDFYTGAQVYASASLCFFTGRPLLSLHLHTQLHA